MTPSAGSFSWAAALRRNAAPRHCAHADMRVALRCSAPRTSAPTTARRSRSRLLAGALDSSSLAFRDESWYVAHDIDFASRAPRRRASSLAHPSALGDGSAVPYEQLLIATGARARRLPAFEGCTNVHELRSLADARRLRDALGGDGRLVVVGAGFIGQEVAATARSMGVEVTIVEALSLPLGSLLGEHVGRWLLEHHREQGVEVLTSARIERVRGNGRVEELDLEDGRSIECAAVLVGIGVVPAADWVDGSGLDPEGVRTDPAGRTSPERIFAAGDVSRPFDPRFGSHTRDRALGSRGAAGSGSGQGDARRATRRHRRCRAFGVTSTGCASSTSATRSTPTRPFRTRRQRPRLRAVTYSRRPPYCGAAGRSSP